VSWSGYGLYWVVAALVFALGFQFFARARPGFADVV
jgi:Flp pilus assembly protein protease CpaA